MASFMKQIEHLKIKIEDIKSATNDFTESNSIGKGGFGKVYRGEICHTMVAIKRLNRAFGQGDPEFWKEIMMLSYYKHENIVSLVGYCDDCNEKILVYEYAQRGSLDSYLDSAELTWVQRLKICIGAARGLEYLHSPTGNLLRVLHRDIKSSNILIDEDWNAKISDFGLSKFGPANQQFTFLVSNVVGTVGYCDPVYVETGILTKESDVYSFGVVLFEVLCGRLCIGSKHRPLTGLARKYYEENKLDEIIHGSIKVEVKPKSLQIFTEIAYRCLKKEREGRPLMKEIVDALETALDYQKETLMTKVKSPSMNNVTRSELDRPTPESKDGPTIEGLRITGDAKLGGKLFASGYSVGGTSLCMFQWVRYFQDGTVDYIEGATYPEYVVTADDVDKFIAVQCIPMDDQGRQGRKIQVFANKKNKITRDGPVIVGLQVIGDAKPGGKLVACGYSVGDTSLCNVQWVRHLQDGTREYIEGATSPEYALTADDVDKLISIECIPMDDQGCRGEIVRLFANEQNKITCDSEMQQEIDKYMAAGHAFFSVLLLMDSSENWEQATFTMSRLSYEVKVNKQQEVFIQEKYTNDVSIKIPLGLSTDFVLTCSDGTSHPFKTSHDVRMCDTLVLTMRMFQSKALDETGKAKA